jgi:hypothetical protein
VLADATFNQQAQQEQSASDNDCDERFLDSFTPAAFVINPETGRNLEWIRRIHNLFTLDSSASRSDASRIGKSAPVQQRLKEKNRASQQGNLSNSSTGKAAADILYPSHFFAMNSLPGHFPFNVQSRPIKH